MASLAPPRHLLALVLAIAADVAAGAGGRQLLDANATVAALEQGLFFSDAADGLCQLGYNCSAGGIPTSRGVCVMTGAGNQCWDVCNPQHVPSDYEIGDNAPENSAFGGLIEQVRAGLNSYVQCPGQLGMGDACAPGSLCKGHMLFKFKVPAGRGMCVVDESEPNGRACWDMCDAGHDPEDFVVGTAEGTAQHVWEVRQRGGCPSTPWWPWFLVALIGLCLLTCCVWVFTVLFRMGRKRTRGLSLERPNSRQEALVPEPENLEDPGPPQAVPEDYRQDSSEYGARGHSAREEYRIPEPPPMEELSRDIMPPEPMPRGMELPPPPQAAELPFPPGRDPSMELFDRIDANHDGQITKEEYEAFFPGSTRAKIPGLDEPNILFPNVQPLQVPQTTAQAVPPDLLAQAMPRNMFLSPDPLGGSQPQVMTPFRMATGNSSNPAFQTNLSPAFSTQPPGSAPSSLRMQPGGLSPVPPSPLLQPRPQAGQHFFTQLARR